MTGTQSKHVLSALIEDAPQGFILGSARGLGDTHLVAALCRAFRARHCGPGDRITFIVKQSHREIAAMFPAIDRVVPVPDLELLAYSDAAAIRQPPGSPERNIPFFAHCNTVRVAPDACVRAGKATDVGMYALMLGLPADAPLAMPAITDSARAEAREIARQIGVVEGRTVLLVPRANSWPFPPDQFWMGLAQRLMRAGWEILVNHDAWPLRCMLPLAELCGWVIGANCGLIQLMVGGEIQCRKTVLTTLMRIKDQPPVSPFPYRQMRTVLGRQYDIEEFVVGDPDTHADLIEAIGTGRNARGGPADPQPLTYVEAPTSPGRLIDRLAMLHLKRLKMPETAHLLAREIDELEPVCAALEKLHPRVAELRVGLAELNAVAWDVDAVLSDAFPTDDGYGTASWRLDRGVPEEIAKAELCLKAVGTAYRAKLDRGRLMDEIDVLCHAGMREQRNSVKPA